ncbi:hypothetical protein [Pseudaminobacter sp. NGMCC 1.201702]|uniref:hypothetical protein n=1 Tax=Pseudaminobacter sp. NGMCC 1.201702 TaxID=3391825 RepID=UPI0039EE6DEA
MAAVHSGFSPDVPCCAACIGNFRRKPAARDWGQQSTLLKRRFFEKPGGDGRMTDFLPFWSPPLFHLWLGAMPRQCSDAQTATSQIMDARLLADVLQEVTPAVVNIKVSSGAPAERKPLYTDPYFHRFFDLTEIPRRPPRLSAGSGVIVDVADGYVITTHHIVEGASQIAVTLKDRLGFALQWQNGLTERTSRTPKTARIVSRERSRPHSWSKVWFRLCNGRLRHLEKTRTRSPDAASTSIPMPGWETGDSDQSNFADASRLLSGRARWSIEHRDHTHEAAQCRFIQVPASDAMHKGRLATCRA